MKLKNFSGNKKELQQVIIDCFSGNKQISIFRFYGINYYFEVAYVQFIVFNFKIFKDNIYTVNISTNEFSDNKNDISNHLTYVFENYFKDINYIGNYSIE